MRHGPIVLLAICSCAFGAVSSHAQDSEEPELGGARARLNVSSLAFYTDNFYNQPSVQTDTIGAVVTPRLNVLAQGRKLDFSTVVDAEYGAFDLPGSEDDYLDGGVFAKLAMQATVRNQVRLSAGFRQGHDPFGVDRTEDVTVRDVELDIWNRTNGSLHYRYGAPGAKLNAEVGVSSLHKEYTTNRAATEFLDYNSTTGEYTLFYNYSPKTSALVDFSRTDFSFDRPFGAVDTRGGQLYRARVGMRWLATGKTSGDVRVGYRRRLFDSGSADIEGVDWEAGVDWAPVPRSTVRLETAHSEQESYRADARVIDIDSASLAWKHNLTARLRSNVKLDYLIADFDSSGREDTIIGATVGLEHLAMSYLWIVGNVGTTTRDSNVAAREYDRLNAFVGVRLGR